MKFSVVVVFVTLATIAVLLKPSTATNSTFGYIGPYDTLLYRQVVVKKSEWLRVVTKDVFYPPKGYVNYYNITGIRAIDRDLKNGGHASLLNGGPGARNTTIHLKSERGYGLNFTVEIFGRA